MSDNKLDDSGKEKVEDGKIVNDPPEKKEGEEFTPKLELKDEPEPKVVEIEDEVLFSHLSKKMGKDVKSLEDLTVEKIVEVQPKFASEQVASINEYVKKTGRSADDWHRTQSVDFTKYSSEQLVKEDLRSKLPDLSGSEIDDYFDSQYNLNTEDFEPKEVSAAKVKLEIEAKRILGDALAIQEQFKVPIKKEESKVAKTEPIIPEKKVAPVEKIDNSEQKKVWVDDMKKSVESLEIINVGEFEIKIDDTVKQSLVDANSNIETFFVDNFIKKVENDNGDIVKEWDFKKLSTIMFLAKEENLNSVIGNIKSNLVGQGKEEIIENRKNLNLPGIGVTQPSSLSPKEEEELNNYKAAMQDSVN